MCSESSTGWDWGLVPSLGPRHSLLVGMKFSFQGITDDEVATLVSDQLGPDQEVTSNMVDEDDGKYVFQIMRRTW